MNDDISDAVKYGDFEVFSGDNYEALLPELKLEGFDSDFDNFLSEMVVSDFDITLTQQAFADLKKSDDPGLPAPETPTSTRFAKLSDDEIKGFQELTQSKATKQSTKWGLKILTARHIMYFSGHRNEASIRSYNRELSSTQKKSASATLSTITTASVKINDPSEDSCVISGQQSQNLQIVPYNSENSNLPVKNELNCSTMSDSSIKSGVLNNSRFENCSITIKYNLD
uniref:Uncharacterized protein n=1 Tax=Magallana gigas TaxID=29159 RepID=K1QTI5_MAGGI